MSNAAERSEIAVLQVQMKGVQSDVSELKTDVKEIKTILLSATTTSISRTEVESMIDAARKDLTRNKWLAVIGATLISSAITALILIATGVKK